MVVYVGPSGREDHAGHEARAARHRSWPVPESSSSRLCMYGTDGNGIPAAQTKTEMVPFPCYRSLNKNRVLGPIIL